MKKFITRTVLIFVVSFTGLNAHGNHTHKETVPQKAEFSKTSVKEIAKKEVKRLSIAKKIDSSWLFVPISKMQKTLFGKKQEWVVSFNNPKINDASKQNLYIFIDLYGKLSGANYTGK